MLSIQDLSNKFTKELPGERAHKAFYPFRYNQLVDISNRKESAVAVHLFKKEEEFHFLLIKRSTYNGHHSGQIAFPGGKKEESDTSFEHTARRESFEEIGIDLGDATLLGKLSPVYIPVSGFLVEPFVFHYPFTPEFQLQDREVASIFSVPIKELLQENVISTMNISSENKLVMKNVPCFNLQEKQVWGATALMINELREVIIKAL